MSVQKMHEAGASVETLLAAIDVENARYWSLHLCENRVRLERSEMNLYMVVYAAGVPWGHPWTVREWAPRLREASQRLKLTYWWALQCDTLTDEQRGELYAEVCRA